jgi:hypothetical protein
MTTPVVTEIRRGCARGKLLSSPKAPPPSHDAAKRAA